MSLTLPLELALLLVAGVTWGMSVMALHRAWRRKRLVDARGINGIAQLLAWARLWRSRIRLLGASAITATAVLLIILPADMSLPALVAEVTLMLLATMLIGTVWIDAHTSAQIERIVDEP